MDDELIEKMARAIYEQHHGDQYSDWPWPDRILGGPTYWRNMATAALAAMREAMAPVASGPTLIEEAEAMVVRLEERADTERDCAMQQDYWHEDDLREAAALLRRMIEQMKGEG